MTADNWITLIEAIVEQFAGFVWIVGPDSRIVAANRLADRLTRSSCQGRSHKRSWSLPILSGAQVSVDLAELAQRSITESEPVTLGGLELELGDAATQCADVSVKPLSAGPAGPMAMVIVAGDSLNPELAIQQVNNQKLQSLTGLAAKIAHELNNPLDGSIRYINLAQKRLEQTAGEQGGQEKLNEYLTSAQQALDRIHDILSDLTQFARTGQSAIETISVNELIEQAVKTLALRAQCAKVSIATVLSDALPPAGVPALYQVFCNLIKNAIDAIEQRRRRDPACPGIITIRSALNDDSVLISVEDSGTGLPANRRAVFEPFFTTKAASGGTGLGLAIAEEIVGECAGRIWAEDRKEGGARLCVELPVLESVNDEVASQ